jgi:hypothetical protein
MAGDDREPGTDPTDEAAGEPAGGLDQELAEELADIDLGRIEREERLAARRLSAIEAGRRKGGAAGAAMAGAMLALQEIYEGPKDEIVAEVEAPGEPGDIDRDGIDVRIGDVDVWAPPPGGRPDDV